MFSKETYINRRARLKELVGHGIILLFGNNEAPCNYPANAYYPFRQDSSFLYYFGQQRDGLVGVIDIDQNEETLIGDDIDIEDIVWYGSVDSVSDMAAQVGVAHSAPMRHLQELCDEARRQGRALHFLPPYRHDIKIQLHDLLGIHPREQKAAASMALIKAVVAMRSVKEPQEIEALERAATIGYKMHTTAMRLTRPGVTEKFVGGQVDGIAHSYGAQVSFATIFSQHGEIMHGNPSMALLEDGRLALCDCGAETVDHYCSDNTRTFPVNGRFTQRQLDIYSIVDSCFMPQGIECEIYQVIGDILAVNSRINLFTGEEVWDFLVQANDLPLHVVINQIDLQGEPRVGRRFKGTVWMQGTAVWDDRPPEASDK